MQHGAFHDEENRKVEIAGERYLYTYASNSIYLAHKLNRLVSERLEIIAWVSVGSTV